MWMKEIDLEDTQSVITSESGDSRRPRWRSWSVETKYLYVMRPTLKWSLKPKTYYDDPRNATTRILGMSNRTVT